MNPLWGILVVNIVALFVVPFLAYRYAHKNNLKMLKEKWITEVRNASAALVEACSRLYSANDSLYQSTSGPTILPDAERKSLQNRRDDAYAEVTGAHAKMRLLFKDGDGDFRGLESTISGLISKVDEPVTTGNLRHMDPNARLQAQGEYLKKVNNLLHRHWNEITT
jgi:hypothetical protein